MAFIGALLTCGKHEDKPAKGGVHFAAQEWHHIISISNWFLGRVAHELPWGGDRRRGFDGNSGRPMKGAGRHFTHCVRATCKPGPSLTAALAFRKSRRLRCMAKFIFPTG
jgi:hypothetical protein